MGDLADDARADEQLADVIGLPVRTANEPETKGTEFMDEEEAALAEEFYEAMMRSSRESPRGKQGARFILGVSDIGFCPERTRRMLDGQVPEPTDVLPAFLGTAIGDHVEKAYQAAHPHVLLQQAVTVQFGVNVDGQVWKISVPGHPDIVDPERGYMLDVKTDYLLADAERHGPDLQKRFQRHMYGLGAWNAGLFGDLPLSEVKVGNVWVDRSGQDRRVHVDLERLDEAVVEQAEAWLEDVVYHLVNKQEAYKAPPRDMCAVVCGYATECRGLDTDVTGLIEDPDVLARVEMYREGQELAGAGERLKKAARSALEQMGMLSGNTPSGLQVRWTDVEGGIVPEHTRRGYTKLDVRPIPKGRRK